MLKTAAIVGWSGTGRIADLERAVVGKMNAKGAQVTRIGQTLVLSAGEPVAAARALGFVPGVAWIAVGYSFKGEGGYLRNLEELARRYLPRNKTFRISAQVLGSDRSVGDLILAGNSHLLSVIPGSKVNERRPDVRFHVSLEGDAGACGVEIRGGPGGVPTNGDWVTCLVSGGEHSSAMTWMAALSGFSLRLVHSSTDESALRHVARLYSELSFRVDERSLELVVLQGEGKPLGRIGSWLRDHDEPAFAGLRLRHPRELTRLGESFPNLRLPLILLQDESIKDVYRSLGLGRSSGALEAPFSLNALKAEGKYNETRFGGSAADPNAVIDAIKRGRT